jgi:Rod binding domain-containing protein
MTVTAEGVTAVSGAAQGASAAAVRPASTPDERKLHQVAKEFETVMVHELLRAAKVGGGGEASEGGQSAYAGMATDAFADGIARAGGLGLAEKLEQAMRNSR